MNNAGHLSTAFRSDYHLVMQHHWFDIAAARGKSGANHQKCSIMSAANSPVSNLVAAMPLVGEASKAGVPMECHTIPGGIGLGQPSIQSGGAFGSSGGLAQYAVTPDTVATLGLQDDGTGNTEDSAGQIVPISFTKLGAVRLGDAQMTDQPLLVLPLPNI